MRHLKRGRKLNRTSAHRKAMLRNMVTSLLEHERIITTLAKAKELRGVTDRVITYAKKGSLHHRRLAARYVRNDSVLNKLFTVYAGRFMERPGGNTRIMRLGWRHGDAAEMAVIELMPEGSTIGRKRKRPGLAEPEAAEASGPVTSKESFADAE